jgi:hypothetical protein
MRKQQQVWGISLSDTAMPRSIRSVLLEWVAHFHPHGSRDWSVILSMFSSVMLMPSSGFELLYELELWPGDLSRERAECFAAGRGDCVNPIGAYEERVLGPQSLRHERRDDGLNWTHLLSRQGRWLRVCAAVIRASRSNASMERWSNRTSISSLVPSASPLTRVNVAAVTNC